MGLFCARGVQLVTLAVDLLLNTRLLIGGSIRVLVLEGLDLLGTLFLRSLGLGLIILKPCIRAVFLLRQISKKIILAGAVLRGGSRVSCMSMRNNSSGAHQKADGEHGTEEKTGFHEVSCKCLAGRHQFIMAGMWPRSDDRTIRDLLRWQKCVQIA
ncbi:hypothetical protein NBRC3255_2963 [Gluconobacter thailandicus NBRC 3255]|nr:hypothetical protein NBRC3255_2963 [Gluconobacter thailandicus NBRC 3255]